MSILAGTPGHPGGAQKFYVIFFLCWAIPPSTAGDFPEAIPEKFRKDPGNALRAFPGIPLESTAGIPQAL